MKVITPEAYKLFHEGSIALAQVEANGICIDVPYLNKVITKVERKISSIQSRLKNDKIFSCWNKTYGPKTNLGSRQQLGKVLFDLMKIPCNNFTEKTNRPSTDEASLEKIDLPFVRRFLRVEKLKKMKSTFLEGIRQEVIDGFAHPFFHLSSGGESDEKGGARSYRSSSSKFGFQQLPKREPEIEKYVRSCIIARPGHRLVEVDCAAHEFRIAACLWKDPEMVKYVKEGRDIHRDIASQLFLCKKEEVNKDTRYLGKNGFVFPVLYGSFYCQCARNIWKELDGKTVGDIPVKEWLESKGITELGACDPERVPEQGTFEHHVKKVEDAFMKKFFVFASSKEEWYRKYREVGGFPMMTGFWCEGLFSKNAVLNYPVQGPAFHCLLWSMIRIQKHINRKGWKTKLIGETHDSILADVPDREVRVYLKTAKRIMTESLPRAWDWIIVPLEIEAEVGPIGGSWLNKKSWVEKDGRWGPK